MSKPSRAAFVQSPVPVVNLIGLTSEDKITQSFCPMREACSLIWTALVRLFRSRASLVAEILVLRHQINIQLVLKRKTYARIEVFRV